MRKTKQFYNLLRQYEALPRSSSKRAELFFKMMEKAQSFSDWASIYQYADSSIRKDAQRKMEKLVLKGKTVSDIQLNILELFMIIDQADKDGILVRYLKKHHDKDDLLFAWENSNWDYGTLEDEVIEKLYKFYKRPGNIHRGFLARRKKSEKMLKKSKFNP